MRYRPAKSAIENRPLRSRAPRQAGFVAPAAGFQGKRFMRLLCVLLALTLLTNAFAFASEGMLKCGLEAHAHT